MTAWQAIILGIVQGLSEFLPISSSGHLVLLQQIFKIENPGIFFEVMLHIGTLIAVLICYRKVIWQIIRKPFNRYTFYLIIATIPAVIITLFLGDFIESSFKQSALLGISFLITAALLFVAYRIPKREKTFNEMRASDALMIGCMQGFALLPGISRSGSTISGAFFRGLEPNFAAEFSFLMSIPAILGSLVLQIKDIITGELLLQSIPWFPMMLGMLFAAVFGFLAIEGMLRVLRKGKLIYFSIYTAVLGLLILLDQNITHLFF